MKVRVNQVLVYHPNMLDRIDGRTSLKSGDVVKVIKMPGCPGPNVMGHCYVGDKDTGKFIGMVHTNSLHTVKEWEAYRAKISVLCGLRLLGATNAPKSAYENVKGGQAAWDALLVDGMIVKEDGCYVLSAPGRCAVNDDGKIVLK